TEVRVDRDVYVRVTPGSVAVTNKPSKSNGKDKPKEKGNQKFGCVVAMDLAARTIDIKKTKKTADLHPAAIYAWDSPINSDAHAESLFRLGEWVSEHGIAAPGPHRAVRDLLLRNMPQLARGESLRLFALEEPVETAKRIAIALDHSVFAIQGPPGAGKTFTGARMI